MFEDLVKGLLEEEDKSICIRKRADDQLKAVKQGGDNRSIIGQMTNH